MRGRDIKRYKAEFPDLWIIIVKYGDYLTLPHKYPTIYQHLLQYKEKLKDRGQCRYSRGSTIDKKKEYPGQHHWLELDNNLKDSYLNEFEKEKIVYAEIVFDSAFHFDSNGIYSEATVFILTGENLRYLTALLNSKFVTYAFRTFYAGGDLRGNTFRYKKVFINNLPIPRISKTKQLTFEILVNYILFAKEHNLEIESKTFESVIDGMVYNLYFEEEMEKADCEVLKHLTNLPEFKDGWSNEEKLETIEKVYKELSDPAHPVSIAMKKMREEVEEVRIIEGL